MNKDTQNKLEKIIQTKTTLFVGIGNALKSDDGIGIYICNNIKQTIKIRTLIVESGIEKFIGKINSIAPEILILVDCTDLQISTKNLVLSIFYPSRKFKILLLILIQFR